MSIAAPAPSSGKSSEVAAEKRAFDSMGGMRGFTGLDKRAFDSFASRGFTGLDKRATFDSMGGMRGFSGFDKRAFDNFVSLLHHQPLITPNAHPLRQ